MPSLGLWDRWDGDLHHPPLTSTDMFSLRFSSFDLYAIRMLAFKYALSFFSGVIVFAVTAVLMWMNVVHLSDQLSEKWGPMIVLALFVPIYFGVSSGGPWVRLTRFESHLIAMILYATTTGIAMHRNWPSRLPVWMRGDLSAVAGWFSGLWSKVAGLAPSLQQGAGGASSLFGDWFVWDVILCLLAAAIIERRYEYFRATTPQVAMADRYWVMRGTYRTLAVSQLAVRLCLAGLAAAFVVRAAWDWFTRSSGRPQFPALDLTRPLSIPGNHPFFVTMAGASLLTAIALALWCRKKPLYDIFMSYKSCDAVLVREVSDRLIAGGASVWLSEYEIPLRNEKQFLRYIDYGLRRSRYGLAFTHGHYADSVYCREEMSGLLRNCGPARILRVKLVDADPVESRFPQITSAPVLRTDGDANSILKFVAGHTGLQPAKVSETRFEPSSFEGVWAGRPYRLDTTGWEKAKVYEGLTTVVGPTLYYIEGPPHLLFNLDIRAERAPEARFRQDFDDRRMYNKLKKYIPEFLGELKAQARGIHLFFHSGLTQMGVTYWVGNHWRRKYSVILPGKENEPAAEFMFTFSYLGDFQGLCGLTPVMERMVRSLKWG